MRNIREDGTLLCPHCGGMHTHHTDICVVEPNGTTTTVNNSEGGYNWPEGFDDKQWDNFMEIIRDNPSKDKSGINIIFGCEHCGRPFMMQIEQHEGETIIGVDY